MQQQKNDKEYQKLINNFCTHRVAIKEASNRDNCAYTYNGKEIVSAV
jgi:hypothetical protein